MLSCRELLVAHGEDKLLPLIALGSSWEEVAVPCATLSASGLADESVRDSLPAAMIADGGGILK